jgi:Serine/threonine protein kinase
MLQSHNKNPDAIELCRLCGKPTGQSRPGSFTGWIFKAGKCQCTIRTAPTKSAEKPDVTLVEQPDHEFPRLASRYEVISFIGEGGMGSVYKVIDQETEQILAIKILRRELAADTTAVKRFEQEAVAASNLDHPNLVPVYGAGHTYDGTPFLIMDFIDGKSLSEVLKQEERVPLNLALEIFVEICDALSHAHSKGIIHRDLKPSNVILSEVDGIRKVHLVDFGIAKVQSSDVRQTIDLTSSGDVLGSPVYMSPEQCLSLSLDARSDIYSFGCLMYEVLTSRPPFTGDNPVQVIARHLNEIPAPISSHPLINVSEDLESIVLTCLEKKPEQRYQDLDALRKDIESVRAGRRVSTARRFNGARKKLPDLSALFVVLVVLSWLGLGFSIWDYDRVSRQVTHANAMVNEANSLSQMVYDAGVAMGGYSITKSPLFSDRFNTFTQKIPLTLNKIARLDSTDRNHDEEIQAIKKLCTQSLKLLGESKAAIDDNRIDVAQFRSRHMYAELRSNADALQAKLKDLTKDDRALLLKSPDANDQLQRVILASAICLILNLLTLFGRRRDGRQSSGWH